MINLIRSITQQILQVNGHIDFICIGSAEDLETRRERKIQNKYMHLQQDLNPRPVLHNR